MAPPFSSFCPLSPSHPSSTSAGSSALLLLSPASDSTHHFTCNHALFSDRNHLPAPALPFLQSPITLKHTPRFASHLLKVGSSGCINQSRRFSGGNSISSSSKHSKNWEVMATEIAKGLWESLGGAFLEHPPTWKSAILANAALFVVATKLLRAGLTEAGIGHAFILAVVTWRAFSGQGLLLVAIFFILGTAATKLKIKQKELEGNAEQRKGRRGPASVWGSGSAGTLCALASIARCGGPSFSPIWKLAFVASFCTKLSDTVSSEIGKAYGKSTYLVTTLQIVPRGTEGAVSLEGTAAGLAAACLISGAAYALNQVDYPGAVICVLASQIANLFESYVGALLQGQYGYEWLNNDFVNVLNITFGAALSILVRSLLS